MLSLLLWVFSNLIFTESRDITSVLFAFLLIAITWYWAPHGQKGRSLLFSAAFYLIQAVSVILSATALGQFGIPLEFMFDIYHPVFALSCFTTSLLSILTFFFLTWLFQRISIGLSEQKIKLWLFFVPIVQVIFWFYALMGYFGLGEPLNFSQIFLIGCIGSLLMNLSCSIVYQKHLSTRELDMKLQQAKDQLHHQTMYFEQMQNNILHINQIRHDLNNQLQAAYYLLDQGNTNAVHNQLDVLKSSISNKVGPRFSSNLMVDAVLSEKAAVCRKHQLPLELSIILPAELPIENAHLCSIFSNILDNSIQAAQQAQDRNSPIRLSSDVQQGFLIIRCENPSNAPKKQKDFNPLRVHGLGMTILQQLAEQYHGRLHAEYENGRFIVTMMLSLASDTI